MRWATLKQHIWEWRGVFSVAPTIAGIAIAPPSLLQEQGQVGFNDFVVDTDGKLRRGFSTTAELIDPESLMSWLNEYRDAMAQVVLAHGGIVDTFIGYVIMAVFGVPIERTISEAIASDAVAAVKCALAMAQQLDILNQQWQQQGRTQTAMLVGIATGQVVAGSLGSSQWLDYTTIGDTVNVAARLESYDKLLDGGVCRLLINKGTYQYIQDKFSTQQIGYVRLKGREPGTVVYKVLRSATVNENSEGSISVNVAITLAEQRSLSRHLRADSFSTTDYHPSSLTEF